MISFYFRFAFLLSLWIAGILLHKQPQWIFISLLFGSALSIALYFFIPIVKNKIYLFSSLILIALFFSLYIGTQTTWLFILMVLFYLFEAAFQIQPRFFNILLILTSTIGCAVSLFQIGLNSSIVFSFFIWVLAAFIFYQYNELYKQSKEQKEIYEGVLDDYRRLKRQALSDEKAARVEERARIAREMHDSVGHMLTALLMHIEVMIIKEKSESLIVIKEMISECLEETRRAVRALQTKDIEGISSVIYLIRKLESESHLKVHFTTKQGVLGASLSNQQSVALYRVIQEGLTNAMKHGSSREVYVILGISPIGHVTFTMKNSNVASKRIHEGFGLKSMRERLNEVGGKFQFIQTEKDFILEGSIPVEEDKND